MERVKEYAVPLLVIAFVLVMASAVASWTGFFIALVALAMGLVIGAYYMAVEVQREMQRVAEEFDEQPFPFL